MPPRDEQRQERKRRRIGLEHRRQQMSFEVVDAKRRHPPCTGQAPAERGADEQCADQPRAGGIGHRVDVRGHGTRLPEHLPNHSRQSPDMIARRQLRHHASELGVDGDLRMHGVADQSARGVVDRDTGLVAGGLDPKYAHRYTAAHVRIRPSPPILPEMPRQERSMQAAANPTCRTQPPWNA